MKKIFIFLCFVSLSLIVGCAKEKPLELSGEKIYELVSVSTVEISAKGDEFTSTGTGFYIDTHGSVVTNYHVIEDCNEITVISFDDQEFTVNGIKGYDIELDIVILATDNDNSKPLPIRNNEIKTGETVYSLGSSLGLTGTFSQGIISSYSRTIDDQEYIQTTAPISNGNSGGPLIDIFGNVIGITTAGYDEGQNLNLAIPISKLDLIDNNTFYSINDFLSLINPIDNLPLLEQEELNTLKTIGTYSTIDSFEEQLLRNPNKFATPGWVHIRGYIIRTESDKVYLVNESWGSTYYGLKYEKKREVISDNMLEMVCCNQCCYRLVMEDDTQNRALTGDYVSITGVYVCETNVFINCTYKLWKKPNNKP